MKASINYLKGGRYYLEIKGYPDCYGEWVVKQKEVLELIKERMGKERKYKEKH